MGFFFCRPSLIARRAVDRKLGWPLLCVHLLEDLGVTHRSFNSLGLATRRGQD